MIWRKFFRRSHADAELSQEIDLFLAEEIDDNIARGMPPDEARRRARLKFGNPQQLHETLWRQNSLAIADSLARDLKYAARTLGRSPGFTVIAILVMALGIGANIAMFTVVRSVLLNPLPYRDPSQLFSVYEHESQKVSHSPYMPVAAGSFTEWQKSTQHVVQMTMASPWQQYNVSAEGGRLPEQIDAAWCAWNFFSVLGVEPALGRSFTAADDRPDAEATVILSAPFWKRRYSSDPAILGRKIWLDARPYTVIGVLPATFAYSGSISGNTAQVWTAVGHEAPPSLMLAVDDHEFMVIARLLPGATLPGLLSQLNTVQRQIKTDHPGPAVHDAVTGRTLLDDSVE